MTFFLASGQAKKEEREGFGDDAGVSAGLVSEWVDRPFKSIFYLSSSSTFKEMNFNMSFSVMTPIM